MQNDTYPATVNEVIDATMTFRPQVLRACDEFKRAKPWRGTDDERHQKLRSLHSALSAAYGLTPQPRLIFGTDAASCSGRSCYIPAMAVIILRGRLSVVTYLHEFAHARGMGERDAARWSLNLFKRVWPKLFARCRHDGHMLRAPEHGAQSGE